MHKRIKRQLNIETIMENEIKNCLINLISKLIAKHSLPTQLCFNFFILPAKILKFFFQPTLHTFASPTKPTPQSKLAKECNCPDAVIDNFNVFLWSYE